MKFDFIIGNPPYQEEVENNGRMNPIYNKFMDEAYKLADIVELITPARFLFDAGQTPKVWNKKMLSDEHLTVIFYEADGEKVFPNTDIKGGVAITLRDAKKSYGAIGTFTAYRELNSIIKKVEMSGVEEYLDFIVSSRGLYRFTEEFFKDYPYASQNVGVGTGNMIVSNIFDKMPEAFYDNKPDQIEAYIRIIGRTDNKRLIKYIEKKYVIDNEYIDKYKIMLPEANGTGRFGETISSPLVALPREGATDTFISIGKFDSKDEAEALLRYIKTKFARAMLGVNKVTQHNPKSVWKMIPMQDFTSSSDIDWSKSVKEIDRQLYAKYGLDENEINFIESHVKEME